MRYWLFIILGMPALASASELTLQPCKEGDLPINVIKIFPAKYPSSPLAFGQDGEVKVEVLVNSGGQANAVTVIEASHEIFARPAIATVKKWEFDKSTEIENRCGVTKIVFKLQ